jgi:hypothetical protein
MFDLRKRRRLPTSRAESGVGVDEARRMIIGTDNSGRDVRIQLDRLVESRMLVQANSGAYNNPRGRLRSLGLIEWELYT